MDFLFRLFSTVILFWSGFARESVNCNYTVPPTGSRRQTIRRNGRSFHWPRTLMRRLPALITKITSSYVAAQANVNIEAVLCITGPRSGSKSPPPGPMNAVRQQQQQQHPRWNYACLRSGNSVRRSWTGRRRRWLTSKDRGAAPGGYVVEGAGRRARVGDPLLPSRDGPGRHPAAAPGPGVRRLDSPASARPMRRRAPTTRRRLRRLQPLY